MRRLAALAFLLFAEVAHAQAPDPLSDAARAYAAFAEDTRDLANAEIDSQLTLHSALERASHDPVALSRGYVAYGALSAAQAERFRAGVQNRVRAAGRAPVLRQLRRDLTYARRRPPNSTDGVQLILQMMAREQTRLDTAARRYEQLDLRQYTWPVLSESDRGSRDAQLRALARQPRSPSLQFTLPFSATTDSTRSVTAARQRTIDQMLTLAGLSIVDGLANDAAYTSGLMDDEPSRQCLQLAQLQFRQCASVAQGGEEDAACLARHGLREVGGCLGAPVAR